MSQGCGGYKFPSTSHPSVRSLASVLIYSKRSRRRFQSPVVDVLLRCVTLLASHVWSQAQFCTRGVGCYAGGGGGIFPRVKRLVAKWIGTRKRLISGFLTAWVWFWNARTFSQCIFYSWTNICIFAPDHELLEYARTLGFGLILLRWRPNLWGVSTTFAFCIKAHGLATFFIVPKNCTFWDASFEPIENLATSCAWKLQGFHGTPVYHCYTLGYVHRTFDYTFFTEGTHCLMRTGCPRTYPFYYTFFAGGTRCLMCTG